MQEMIILWKKMILLMLVSNKAYLLLSLRPAVDDTWGFLDFDQDASKTMARLILENNSSNKEDYAEGKRYSASWSSLDTRPVPRWYDEAKFGIFVHWGVYSVPSYGSEWFWWHLDGDHKTDYKKFMRKMFPNKSYQDLAPLLTGEYFNAKEWARIVESSGARYFVFTSKHHEGFTFWQSDQSWNWNSVDMGPRRDILAELKQAIEETNVTFGLYFSLYEWFNPLYKRDKRNNFKTQEFVEMKIQKQLRDLITRYTPKYLWSDGDWEATSDYWKSTEFLAWLYNESPVKDTILVNDRWGLDANCVHGDVKTCKDRYNPGAQVPYKWENAMTIDKDSWGYRREAKLKDYMSPGKLIETLIQTVSYGGNLLMNIGPTSDGRILPIFEERLLQVGDWLKINGEGIYGTRSWRVQRDPMAWKVWYTAKGNTVYAHMCRWPKGSLLFISEPRPTSATTVKMLGYGHPIRWEPLRAGMGLKLDLSLIPTDELKSSYAWTFKMEYVE